MARDESSDAIAMNFSWVETDSVAGCRGPRTHADLAYLASQGVTALVRLAHDTETGIYKSDVESHDIEDFYEPVKDFTAPSQDQISRVIGFIHKSRQEGKKVAVSCNAGCGRTGTILACYLVSKGLPPKEALQRLIASRPCSTEVSRVPGQKHAIHEFFSRLR